MKVLFLSDTHVGFARRSRVYPERKNDAIEGMKNALSLADKEKVDVVLHGGDLFDTRRPDAILIHEVMDLVRSLPVGSYRVKIFDLKGRLLEDRKTDRLPFVAVHGNHDFMEGEKNLYTLLSHLPNFFYAHKRRIVIEKDGESICVVGMGYIPDKYALEYVRRYRGVHCDGPSFFLFHQPVEGLYPTLGREKPLPPAVFPEGFNYYLGGHLHWVVNKTVANRHFLIPGSTVVTRLKEGEMEKPRIVYVIEGNEVKEVEVPGARRAYKVEVEVEGDVLAVKDAIEKILREHRGKPPLVKVVLVGERKGTISEEVLRKEFQGRALIYVFDKREDVFTKRLRELRTSLGSEAFSEELFLQELKAVLGDRWEDAMEEVVKMAVEGNEEGIYRAIEGAEENKKEKKGGILDWT